MILKLLAFPDSATAFLVFLSHSPYFITGAPSTVPISAYLNVPPTVMPAQLLLNMHG